MTGIAACVYSRTHDLNVDSHLGGILSASTHLVTVFPFLVAGMFEFRRSIPALATGLVAATAALGVGYFTFNRNFILAIDALGLTMAVLLIRRHIVGRRSMAILTLAGGIAVVSSGLFFQSVVLHRSGNADTTVRSALENDPRLSIWRFSLDLIREHPLTGAGFGRFAAVDSYRGRFPEDRTNAHAHNPFLNYAVQMGIGGVVILLFLLCSLVREFWKLWECDQAQVRLIGLTGLAMIAGVLVKTQTDDLWGRQHGYLFWALTGMMLGYAHRLYRHPRPDAAVSDQHGAKLVKNPDSS
jgi:O-antigen ligase